jgi:hypothetical protein
LGQGISLFWAPWAFWRSLTCRLKHVIFHSYVSWPEGNYKFCFSHIVMIPYYCKDKWYPACYRQPYRGPVINTRLKWIPSLKKVFPTAWPLFGRILNLKFGAGLLPVRLSKTVPTLDG